MTSNLVESMNKSVVLSKDKQYELIRLAKNGDKKAMEQLIDCNLKYICKLAQKYVTKKYTIDDAMADGVIGLMESIKGFDLSKGYSFITYAQFNVIREMELGNLTHHDVSVPKTTNSYLLLKKEEHKNVIDRNKKYQYALFPCSRFNYDNSYESDGTEHTGYNITSVEGDYGYSSTNVDKELFRQTIRQCINDLPVKPRDKEIFIDLHGLDDYKKKSLQTVAEQFNLTKERVRQINLRCSRILKSKLPNYGIEESLLA